METVTIDGGNSGVASNRVELAGAVWLRRACS
jgi:hypothetical protein